MKPISRALHFPTSLATAAVPLGQIWSQRLASRAQKNVTGILATLTENAVYSLANSPYRWTGPEQIKQFYRELYSAIPQVRFITLRTLVGPQGIFEECRLTGSHEGTFRDYAPSLRAIDSVVGIFHTWDAEKGLFTGETV